MSRRDAANLLTTTIDDQYNATIPIRRGMYRAAKVLNGGVAKPDGSVVGGNMIDTKELVGIFNKNRKIESFKFVANQIFDEGPKELGTIVTNAKGTNTWKAALSLDKAIDIRSSLNQIVREKGLRTPEGRTANFL